MKRRILVIGGAGYIGSHMVRHLLEAQEEVVVVDNLSQGHQESLETIKLSLLGEANTPSFSFYEGNFGERAWMENLLRTEKITHVMHFAANAYVNESISNPLKYYSNNVANVIRLLEAMVAVGVPYFVFSSSCATYGAPQKLPLVETHPQAPISPYGTSKLMVENILRDLARTGKLAYAALRYFNAAGASRDAVIGEDHTPETHLIPLVLQVALGQRKDITIFGNDYPTPDGTCLRDYVHVEDLADAHLKAINILKAPGDRIEVNLGTGKPCSVQEIISVCRQVTGHPIPSTMAAARDGDTAMLYADNRLAREILGWQPKYTDIREIVGTAWAWHKSHPKGYAEALLNPSLVKLN